MCKTDYGGGGGGGGKTVPKIDYVICEQPLCIFLFKLFFFYTLTHVAIPFYTHATVHVYSVVIYGSYLVIFGLNPVLNF